jgi:hypothetical protein
MLEPHDHATLTVTRSEPTYTCRDLQRMCAQVRSAIEGAARHTRELRAVDACVQAHDLRAALLELEARLAAAAHEVTPALTLTLTHVYESLQYLHQHLQELWAQGAQKDPRWLASWRAPRLCLALLEQHARVVKERFARATVLLELLPRQHSPSAPVPIPVPPRPPASPPATAFSTSPNFTYTEILLEEVDGGIVADYWTAT